MIKTSWLFMFMFKCNQGKCRPMKDRNGNLSVELDRGLAEAVLNGGVVEVW